MGSPQSWGLHAPELRAPAGEGLTGEHSAHFCPLCPGAFYTSVACMFSKLPTGLRLCGPAASLASCKTCLIQDMCFVKITLILDPGPTVKYPRKASGLTLPILTTPF